MFWMLRNEEPQLFISLGLVLVGVALLLVLFGAMIVAVIPFATGYLWAVITAGVGFPVDYRPLAPMFVSWEYIKYVLLGGAGFGLVLTIAFALSVCSWDKEAMENIE